MFKEGQRIVFIGDSITDCGREDDPEGIGSGYVRIVNDYLSLMLPDVTLRVENRGVSGETILDLKARWQEDVVALKPDWLSVSIGINDEWKQVGPERYRDTYRELLRETIGQCGSSLVLMETTIISEIRTTAATNGCSLIIGSSGKWRRSLGRFSCGRMSCFNDTCGLSGGKLSPTTRFI